MKTAGRTLTIFGILAVSAFFSASGQWKQTEGLCGGSFETIATADSTLFTNVLGRGVFRTADEGKSWTAINGGLKGRDIFALAAIGNELFAGTEFNGLHIYSGSTSGWSGFTSTSGNSFDKVSDIAVCGQEVWVATFNGLVKLYKKENAWVDTMIYPLSEFRALAVTDGFMVAATATALVRSTDHGTTWTECTTGLPQSPTSCLVILDDTTGLAGTLEGAYITRNGGDSWDSAGGVLTAKTAADVRGFAARNDTILLAADDGIWLSIDRGSTWAGFNDAYAFDTPKKITLVGNTIFLATARGIFTSSFSDRQWTDISTGIISGKVNTMLKVENTIFAGCDANHRLYRSEDDGLHWTVSDSGMDDQPRVLSIAYFDSVLLTGCSNQNMMLSTDFGRSWTKSDASIGIIHSFIHVNTTLLAGHNFSGVQSLDSSDAAFQDANTGIYLNVPDCGCSSPYYPTPSSFTILDNTIFAALRNRGVHSSDKDDLAWTPVDSSLSDTAVIALYTFNRVVLAGSNEQGIFRSTDGGASWNISRTDLHGNPVFTFASTGSAVFAGTGNGVFCSVDSGITWHKDADGLNDSVPSLLIDGEYILAGTTTQGVVRRPVSEIVSSGVKTPRKRDMVTGASVVMKKEGNALVCRYTLSRPEKVTVSMYDLRGRNVRTILNARVSAGENILRTDLGNFTYGCYIIRFTTESLCRSTSFVVPQRP